VSRPTRVIALFSTIIATLVLSIPAASAYTLPQPTRTGPVQASAPAVIHAASSSGLAGWVVLLIALAALAVGAVATEVARVVGRRHQRQIVATA
jgi:hypothetical protein